MKGRTGRKLPFPSNPSQTLEMYSKQLFAAAPTRALPWALHGRGSACSSSVPPCSLHSSIGTPWAEPSSGTTPQLPKAVSQSSFQCPFSQSTPTPCSGCPSHRTGQGAGGELAERCTSSSLCFRRTFSFHCAWLRVAGFILHFTLKETQPGLPNTTRFSVKTWTS